MAKVRNAYPCPSCGAVIQKSEFIKSKICANCGDDLSDDNEILKAFDLFDDDADDDDFNRLLQNSSKYGNKSRQVTEDTPVDPTPKRATPVVERPKPAASSNNQNMDAAELQARLRAMTVPGKAEVESKPQMIEPEYVEPVEFTPRVEPQPVTPEPVYEPEVEQVMEEPEPYVAPKAPAQRPVPERVAPAPQPVVQATPQQAPQTPRIIQLADGRFIDTFTGEFLDVMGVQPSRPEPAQEIPAENIPTVNEELIDEEESSSNNLIDSMVNKLSESPLKKTKNIADAMRENYENANPHVDANSYDMAPNEKREKVGNYNSNADHYYDDTQASIPPEPDIIKASTIRHVVLCIAGLFAFAAFMIYYI